MNLYKLKSIDVLNNHIEFSVEKSIDTIFYYKNNNIKSKGFTFDEVKSPENNKSTIIIDMDFKPKHSNTAFLYFYQLAIVKIREQKLEQLL